MADAEPNQRPTLSSGAPRGGRDLTTGPIAKTLLLFALPTLGGNVLQSLNGSINAVWIGNMLGEAALAATANATNIMFLGFSAIFGLAMATTILIAQAIGGGNLDLARRTLGASIGLVTAIATVTAVLGWLETPALLRALSTPAEAMPLATIYLRVIFAGMPFTFLTVLLSSALRGAGDAITPLRAMILNVVLDAGLNPFLIAGIGPFPRLGIAGSALATLLAGLITVAFLVGYIYAKDLPLRLKRSELAYLAHGRALMGTILSKGLPMGLSMIVLSASALAMMGLVNRAGVETTAAFGAISQLWNYIQMPALAVGAGVSAMVAQNIGAGRWDRVERIAWAGSAMNLAMTGVLLMLITLTDRILLALFLTPSSPAVAIGVHINLIVGWSFLMFSVSLILTSVMRANGAVVFPLVMMIVAFFPVRFGMAYLLEPSWGAEAIWWSFPVGSAVSLAMTLVYYRWGGWRRARMLASGTSTR